MPGGSVVAIVVGVVVAILLPVCMAWIARRPGKIVFGGRGFWVAKGADRSPEYLFEEIRRVVMMSDTDPVRLQRKCVHLELVMGASDVLAVNERMRGYSRLVKRLEGLAGLPVESRRRLELSLAEDNPRILFERA